MSPALLAPCAGSRGMLSPTRVPKQEQGRSVGSSCTHSSGLHPPRVACTTFWGSVTCPAPFQPACCAHPATGVRLCPLGRTEGLLPSPAERGDKDRGVSSLSLSGIFLPTPFLFQHQALQADHVKVHGVCKDTTGGSARPQNTWRRSHLLLLLGGESCTSLSSPRRGP